MKISIITPSVRPELLQIVKKCLDRQTFCKKLEGNEPFTQFEWIIECPADMKLEINSKLDIGNGYPIYILNEPKKKEGDYYNLNKAWNDGFKSSSGELIVEITDGIWFPPDTLQKLWDHYEANPKACITTVGHQYDQIVNGKPEHLVWQDPRCRSDLGTFYEINPNDLELCIGSIPRQAILDVGGIDETFDLYAAMSEKEMALRMDKAGYKFFIDQSIEYRATKHPRLNEEWDARYLAGIPYFQKCIHEIVQGDRMKLDFLS